MKGHVLYNNSNTITVTANASQVYSKVSTSDIEALVKNEIYISCQLTTNEGKVIAKNIYYFVKPKQLLLLAPETTISFSKEKKCLLVTSKNHVKDFYLFSNNPQITFGDNYFDIEPNQTIEIKTNVGPESLNQIQHMSLFDINH